ncbi:methyltransferase-like protein-like protein 6 [Ramicandelaber brevisporus]|nr:methyltransferase-like protein-like protein 6 [Ramicandelaber brevisporus]
MADQQPDYAVDEDTYVPSALDFEEHKKRALEILAQDNKPVTAFWGNKYINESTRYWDIFYKRNTTNFFKDRHWLDREFEELRPQPVDEAVRDRQRKQIELDIEAGTAPHPLDGHRRVLETGCGVGNFVFPALERNDQLFIYACDLSKNAIELVCSNDIYKSTRRCQGFVCNVVSDPLTATIPAHTIDVATALFVMSALDPETQMPQFIQNLKSVMADGGTVLFRDYGIYDAAQLRFKPGHRVKENLYARQDGTLAYYFSVEILREMFEREGFEVIELDYVFRRTRNFKKELDVVRVFVQGRFRAKITN